MQDNHVPIQRQIINQKNDYFDENFRTTIDSLQLPPLSKDYLLISIIGVQNSGKSTLLNHLFGTQFQVLTKTAGSQTTKGIWLAKDKEAKLVVLDVEGNDSAERAIDNNNNFEKTVAMYALALSNLLIVNIWTKTFGTYQGSQYGIVKLLMEMSLKMFKQEAPKVILFCLRDFTEEDSIDYVTNTIVTDVEGLWKKIEKPANYEKSERDKFFKIKVHPLRRYRATKPEPFIEDVNSLRKKLIDPTDPEYIFNNKEISYNLPIRDLAELSKNAWDAVISNKDLNLPNEKTQLANLKCNLIKGEIVAAFNEEINAELPKHTSRDSFLELSSWIEERIEFHDKDYLEKAAGYEKKIVKEKAEELKKQLHIKVQDEIEKLAKIKRDNLMAKFEQRIKFNKTAIKQTSATLMTYLDSIIQQFIKDFDKFNDEIKFSFPQKREMASAFETNLKSIAHNKQKRLEQEIKQDYEVSSRRAVEGVVYDLVGNHLDAEFWKNVEKQFNKLFNKEIEKYADEYHWVVGDKFHQSQVQEKKELLYTTVKNEIIGKLELILVNKLLEGFRKRFTKDKEGNTRNWLVIDDKEIEQIFQSARQETIRIYRILNDVPNFSIDASQTPDQVRQQLFEPNKLSKINDDLETKMTEEFENTIRSKKQTEMSKVPWYLWLVFLFFTYDDLWFGEDYPFVYYPSMIILSVIALLLSMGYKDQLFALWAFVMEKLKEKFSFLR